MAIKVALVSGDFRPPRCGVAHYTARLAEALAARDVEPIVMTTRQAARETPSLPVLDGRRRSASVPVLGAVDGWGLRQLAPLVRAVARERPDVVHVEYAPSSFGHSRTITVAPPLLRALGVPTIATVHEYGGWDFELPPLPAGLVARLAALGERRGWWDREALLLPAQSDRVVVTNTSHRDLLAGRLRGLDGALHVVPVGPNVRVTPGGQTEHRRRVRAELGIGDADPLVCFFGFLHPVKGLDTLLRAFARLKAKRPAARLILVGGFESLALRGSEAQDYRRRVESAIAGLGLVGAVALTGYLPDAEVSARLQAADVCALPFNPGVTLKSGSLLAALAHGLPTVVTAGERPAPGLIPGEQVLAVPARDPEALAGALDDLLGGAALRERLRAGGLALAARYDWPAIAAEHLAIYAEALRRG